MVLQETKNDFKRIRVHKKYDFYEIKEKKRLRWPQKRAKNTLKIEVRRPAHGVNRTRLTDTIGDAFFFVFLI